MINSDGYISVLILCAGGLGLLTLLTLVLTPSDKDCTGFTINGTCHPVKGCGTDRERFYFCEGEEECREQDHGRAGCDCEEGFRRQKESARCSQRFTRASCQPNTILNFTTNGVLCVENPCPVSQCGSYSLIRPVGRWGES